MPSSDSDPPDGAMPEVSSEACRRPRRISHLAVASLMVAILSLLGLALPITITHWDSVIQKWLLWPPSWSLAGFILGLAAILSIGWSRGRLSGKGYAYTGTAISAVVLCLALPMWADFFYPAYLDERAEPARRACHDHMWLLTMAATMYARDFNGRLPPADTWCDALLPYVGGRDDFVCPARPQLRCGYAYNRALSGRLVSSIPDPERTVLFYESDLGWNGSGGPEAVISNPRHRDVANFGMVDGFTRPVHAEQPPELVWQPKAPESRRP